MAKHIDFTKQPAAVRLAATAIGLDHKRPYSRGCRRFYRPYRNYYNAKKHSSDAMEWGILVACGMARVRFGGDDIIQFWLTRDGLDWLGKKLNITIRDLGDKNEND